MDKTGEPEIGTNDWVIANEAPWQAENAEEKAEEKAQHARDVAQPSGLTLGAMRMFGHEGPFQSVKILARLPHVIAAAVVVERAGRAAGSPQVTRYRDPVAVH